MDNFHRFSGIHTICINQHKQVCLRKFTSHIQVQGNEIADKKQQMKAKTYPDYTQYESPAEIISKYNKQMVNPQ